MSESRSRGMVVLSMLIFGTIGYFVSAMNVPSPVIAMVRGLLGAGVLALVLLLRGKKPDMAAIRRNGVKLVLSGVTIGFNWILLFESYRYASVPVSTLCYYMQPVYVTLLAPLVLKEKLTPWKLLCVLVALIGMIPVSGVLGGGADVRFTGILLALGAGVLYACVVLINKRINGIDAWSMTLVQLASAGLVMIPYNLLTGAFAGLSLRGLDIGLLAVVSVIHTGAAYTLYFGGIQRISGQSAAIMSYIDPIVAVGLGVFLPGQKPDGWTILGALLILGATLLSDREPAAVRNLRKE